MNWFRSKQNRRQRLKCHVWWSRRTKKCNPKKRATMIGICNFPFYPLFVCIGIVAFVRTLRCHLWLVFRLHVCMAQNLRPLHLFFVVIFVWIINIQMKRCRGIYFLKRCVYDLWLCLCVCDYSWLFSNGIELRRPFLLLPIYMICHCTMNSTVRGRMYKSLGISGSFLSISSKKRYTLWWCSPCMWCASNCFDHRIYWPSPWK